MAATYVNVTRDEIESFLLPQGFARLDLDGVRELVYAKRVDQDGHALSLRVFTGIEPSGVSRDVGVDAIRCAIFWRRPDGAVRKVATTKRVHRVAGWRKNLADRLATLRIGPSCPTCGAPMVVRKGKTGEFHGCAGFPECRRTMEIAK